MYTYHVRTLQTELVLGLGAVKTSREGKSLLHMEPQRLPIIVMTASNRQADIQKAMALGATAYQVKPGSFHYLVGVARELRELWLNPEKLGKRADFVRASRRAARALPRSLYRRPAA